jgi:hypothetical protein
VNIGRRSVRRIRDVIVIAELLGFGLCFGFGALDTVASATPVGHPVPQVATTDARVVVIDDPSLMQGRPLPVDSWSRGESNGALSVQFSLASPGCSAVHAEVDETADAVTVELRVGTRPDAIGRMCTMIVVPATLEVTLQAPLGARTVLSAY